MVYDCNFHIIMPKAGSSKSDLLRKRIKVSSYLTTDGKVVFCNACSKQVRTYFILQNNFSNAS